MNVLLIDADSKIPNLALMKLSTYHKSHGDSVDLIKLNLPYYPNRKKIFHYISNDYDKKYCSVIFDGNKRYIKGDNILFGGTGVNLDTTLLPEIESLEPDYTIYPNNIFSYGFITRGCIRKCSFCKVPKKEGYIHLVNEPENIIKHKITKFLDNNILAYNEHKRILQKLIDFKSKIQFNQGLDIRLIDSENSKLLSSLNYFGEYIFAFDNIKYKNIIQEKLKKLSWRHDWQFKFFVYIHPEMSLNETIERIKWLKNHKCLPYIMRDISCWNSEYNDFYVDIAAYCNQVNLFKKMDFDSFLEKRHTNKDRIIMSKKLYKENEKI